VVIETVHFFETEPATHAAMTFGNKEDSTGSVFTVMGNKLNFFS